MQIAVTHTAGNLPCPYDPHEPRSRYPRNKARYLPRHRCRTLFYRKAPGCVDYHTADKMEASDDPPLQHAKRASARIERPAMFIPETMLARAKADRQTIVLPEGDDEHPGGGRAHLGRRHRRPVISATSRHRDSPYKLSGARIIDPRTSELRGSPGALKLRKARDGVSDGIPGRCCTSA